MDRTAIRQYVEDTLGVILVDKSVIKDSATFKELVLDDDDITMLFSLLEKNFGIVVKAAIKRKAIKQPERMTLALLVDLIMMKEHL